MSLEKVLRTEAQTYQEVVKGYDEVINQAKSELKRMGYGTIGHIESESHIEFVLKPKRELLNVIANRLEELIEPDMTTSGIELLIDEFEEVIKNNNVYIKSDTNQLKDLRVYTHEHLATERSIMYKRSVIDQLSEILERLGNIVKQNYDVPAPVEEVTKPTKATTTNKKTTKKEEE